MKISKKQEQARGQVDRMKSYSLGDAIATLAKMPKAKFDETVELSVHLGVDPRQTTQMVRGIVELPNGSGKKVRVIVFTENVEEAKAAGADEAGLEDLITKVKDGWVDFDVAVATTSAMREVRQVARVLGPRGLMPNPKSGTVTDDIPAALKAIKSGGRVEFKMDKTANVGVIVGKRSFNGDQLSENIRTAIDAVGKMRPDNLKGRKYIRSMAISGTMTPGIKLDPSLFSHF